MGLAPAFTRVLHVATSSCLRHHPASHFFQQHLTTTSTDQPHSLPPNTPRYPAMKFPSFGRLNQEVLAATKKTTAPKALKTETTTQPQKKRKADFVIDLTKDETEDEPEHDVRPSKLQTLSAECPICCEDKPIFLFPNGTHRHPGTQEHHKNSVCLKCWENHLHSELERKEWDKVSCRRSRSLIPSLRKESNPCEFSSKAYISARALLTQPRIQEKATKAFLKADADWVDCPSATCKSGSSMADGHIFTCRDCKYRYCFSCEISMHENESCTEYHERINRTKEKAQEEDLSKKKVEEVSKPCPKCSSRLDKWTGCDHVTCRQCRHEFCWLCFADYGGPDGIHRKGNAAHKNSCAYAPNRLPAHPN